MRPERYELGSMRTAVLLPPFAYPEQEAGIAPPAGARDRELFSRRLTVGGKVISFTKGIVKFVSQVTSERLRCASAVMLFVVPRITHRMASWGSKEGSAKSRDHRVAPRRTEREREREALVAADPQNALTARLPHAVASRG
jgi:hypothetical protein